MAVAGFGGLGFWSKGHSLREMPIPEPAGRSLLDRFSALNDPGQQAKVLYLLREILLLLLCATLAGADDLVEIALGGDRQLDVLRPGLGPAPLCREPIISLQAHPRRSSSGSRLPAPRRPPQDRRVGTSMG